LDKNVVLRGLGLLRLIEFYIQKERGLVIMSSLTYQKNVIFIITFFWYVKDFGW